MAKVLNTALVLCVLFYVSCNSQQKNEQYVGESFWNCSEWISVAAAPIVDGVVKPDDNNRAADGASWFVSSLRNKKVVVKAQITATSLGVFQLYVNGASIGEEFLRPGFAHPQKTKYSFTYDITSLFKCNSSDTNCIASQVTPGWWADKIITPHNNKGMVGKKTAFRAVLQLTYDDGSVDYWGTDTVNWRAGIAGPVKHADIFDGEEYDAREKLGFLTFDKLSTPEINTEFKGDILASNGAEVYLRKDLTLKPIDIYVYKDIIQQDDSHFGKIIKLREYDYGNIIQLAKGETLIVDFGQNCAAIPSFEFKAEEGTTITCLPSEILNDGKGAIYRGMDGPEGSVHRASLRTPNNAFLLKYTFANNKNFVSYHPECTYFGYRYISITSSADVVFRSILSIPISSLTTSLKTGTITTGNELINKLISNTVWSMRSNYISIPTDCPQRNERLGWMADAQIFAETGTFFANTNAFFHKWMRDVRNSQSFTGAFPGVAPLAQYGNDKMRVGWSDAGIIVPYTIWKQFGDISIIEENWEAMEKYMKYLDLTKYDHSRLSDENRNYQWADWLSYEPLESRSGRYLNNASGKKMASPEAVEYWNFLGACYWASDAEMMRNMAAAIGKDSEKYKIMYQNAQLYLKERFLDKNGLFKVNVFNYMQTPILFALKNNLVEGKAKKSMIDMLRKNFAEHGNCLQTGFLGTSILMQTLTENGMEDIAYDLLFQRNNPSWLYSIDNGATTLWERWNSYTIESGMGPTDMNSFNHYAYGVVCEWIWECAAGIAADPSVPGFKNIIMSPHPDRRLGSISAEYKSSAGLIKSNWKYENDKWIWNFTIPEGATAMVTIPGESESKNYTSGSWKITKIIKH